MTTTLNKPLVNVENYHDLITLIDTAYYDFTGDDWRALEQTAWNITDETGALR